MVHVMQGSRVNSGQLQDRIQSITKYANRWLEIKDYDLKEWRTETQITTTPYGAIANIVHTYDGACFWTGPLTKSKNDPIQEEAKRLNPFQ